MNDFTKEELQIIHLDMTTYINRTPMLNESPSHKALRDKVESMIDNYQDEREIHSCHTGLAVSDDFFCKQQHMNCDDLLPAIHQLVKQCDGIIKHPGIYAFKLRLVKIK